ncbi:hypothetical protein BJF93_23295 [Xaviernesmea oryzae]|uniref:Uncharacterized protein n=1 Tax=Xaviernesmea oryzae TaxID=464029 RepID=A0A1Q9AU42_9HYPH|nr:hypothetical protein BJF93_23295 [Xaviernesmea oryzae]
MASGRDDMRNSRRWIDRVAEDTGTVRRAEAAVEGHAPAVSIGPKSLCERLQIEKNDPRVVLVIGSPIEMGIAAVSQLRDAEFRGRNAQRVHDRSNMGCGRHKHVTQVALREFGYGQVKQARARTWFE